MAVKILGWPKSFQASSDLIAALTQLMFTESRTKTEISDSQ